MIRVVIFFVLVGLAALGVAWLADRPGAVAITWLGYRIETSVMVMAAALAMLIALSILLWSILRAVLRSPGSVSLFMQHRRSAQGYQAISRGLIAIGSGDPAAARRLSQNAQRLAPDDPLQLLLAAQSAQLSGDRPAAEQAFRAMLARQDTKLLALHGLYVEAQRRDDFAAARAFAEQAGALSPSLTWAGQAVLEFRCAEGDWTGALDALDRNFKSKLVKRPQYKRQRAVLLTARAQALEDGDREVAKGLALEAARLAPDLVPAAVLAGRLLAEDRDLRRAGRVIEAAWRVNPHPDLAETYAYQRPGSAARDRLARVQALAKHAPGHVESALAVARAAIDAREFDVARQALAPLLALPTQRVAMLMAELEEAEQGDIGRAREWMARAVHAVRDPAWTADGIVSDKWMPVSPATGRLDAFQWRVPLAELVSEGALIEEREIVPVVPIAPESALDTPTPDKPAETPDATARPAPAAEPLPTPAPLSNPRSAGPRLAGRTVSARARASQPVIPLVHTPDDPGPEPEPVPAGGWRRIRQMFGISG